MAGTQSVRAPSVDDEPGDISAPQSPSSIASVRSSSVFSAAKKLVQVRENLTEFHKKGGIVGWLHGDESEVRTASAVDQAADVSDELGDTLVLAYSPKRSSREALNLQLWQSSPLSASATETAVAEDDGLYTPPSPRSVSTSPAKLCTPPSTPLAAQVSGRSSYSSSVIESLYEKVLKASTSSSSPRHSLQPSPRRKSGRVDALVSGFDDFVGTDGSSRSRFFRDRTGSDPNILLRSPSASAQPNRGRAWTSPSAATPLPTLTLEDCLEDPRLVAEFTCVGLPEDGALLPFYFALDKFVNEATASAATAKSLIQQLNMLREQAKSWNQSPSDMPVRGGVGPHTVAALVKIPSSSAVNVDALESTDTAPAAVSLLLRSAHAAVYSELEMAFEQDFRGSIAFQRALSDRQSRINLVDPTRLFINALLDDEWASTVLWTYQFRLARHQQLSFLIDARFRLERVFSVCMASTGDRHRFSPLVECLSNIRDKYLATSATTTSPYSSSDAERLRVSASTRIARLANAKNDSDEDFRARLVATMEGIRALVRAERNALVASERLTNFSSSSLFRDFVALPTAPRGDIVRLLRAAGIPFHQAPKQTTEGRDLIIEAAMKGNAKELIHRVFTFEDQQERTLQFKQIFPCGGCADDAVQAEDTALIKTMEGFIAPEAEMDTNAHSKRILFHFLTGTGEDTLYGAVLRYHDASLTQGVCVLARAPLVESLRCFLLSFWRNLNANETLHINELAKDSLVNALAAAESALNGFLPTSYTQAGLAEINAPSLPFLDVGIERLFARLPISILLRTFSCLLSERKVLFVSTSLSALVETAEGMRSLLFPLQWPHVFAPVLPLALHEFLQCPSPFLFGMSANSLAHCELPTDVVVVDLDCGSITGDEIEAIDPVLAVLEMQLTGFYRLCGSSRDIIDDLPFKFPESDARRTFETTVRSIVSTLETAAFHFETTEVSNDDATGVVVAVMDATSSPDDANSPLLAAIRQSQAFSAHLCRSK